MEQTTQQQQEELESVSAAACYCCWCDASPSVLARSIASDVLIPSLQHIINIINKTAPGRGGVPAGGGGAAQAQRRGGGGRLRPQEGALRRGAYVRGVVM